MASQPPFAGCGRRTCPRPANQSIPFKAIRASCDDVRVPVMRLDAFPPRSLDRRLAELFNPLRLEPM